MGAPISLLEGTQVTPRPEKVAVVEEIRSKIADADATVLTEYRGLSVGALAELRNALRPAGTEYKIFKNTLTRRAVEEAGYTDLLPLLEGPVALAFVHGDAVVAAKAMREFARDHDSLVFKGGMLGERLLVAAEIEALAKVPPKDVILGRLAGGFQAPLTRAAGLFQAFTRNFAYGLAAYADQRSSEAPTGDEEPQAPADDAETDRPAPEPQQPESQQSEESEPAADEAAEGAKE